MANDEKLLRSSILTALLLTATLWVVKGAELIGDFNLTWLGILPLQAKGLAGILFSPLLHADLAHLTANSTPLFFLGAALFYFYRKHAWSILSLLWLLTGAWVWLLARGNSYHIGASGVVYALAAFHFTGGLLRKEPRLMAFSLLVIFLYGSMVWGVFPDFFPKQNISWESHLMGAIAGILLAFYYRQNGPQPKKYSWELEDEEETDIPYDIHNDDEPTGLAPPPKNPGFHTSNQKNTIIYHYTPDKDENKNAEDGSTGA
ncbi:MAG: rhomboid family intramembrane serine protease [Lentimicrobiaceae bacterium]|nr:rhomboid family intramembrane serine protease [Lentimicrobiaceae bacterium]